MDRKSRGQNSALSVLPCAVLPIPGAQGGLSHWTQAQLLLLGPCSEDLRLPEPLPLGRFPKGAQSWGCCPVCPPRQLDQENGSPACPWGQVSCETLSRGAVLPPLCPRGNQARRRQDEAQPWAVGGVRPDPAPTQPVALLWGVTSQRGLGVQGRGGGGGLSQGSHSASVALSLWMTT